MMIHTYMPSSAPTKFPTHDAHEQVYLYRAWYCTLTQTTHRAHVHHQRALKTYLARIAHRLSRTHSTVVVVVDSHIPHTVLAIEETTVTQAVSYRPIKCQSRSWSQRGTKVNGSHHGDSPLLKPTGIPIATKPFPGPTNREHRKLIGVKTMSSGTNYICF